MARFNIHSYQRQYAIGKRALEFVERNLRVIAEPARDHPA